MTTEVLGTRQFGLQVLRYVTSALSPPPVKQEKRRRSPASVARELSYCRVVRVHCQWHSARLSANDSQIYCRTSLRSRFVVFSTSVRGTGDEEPRSMAAPRVRQRQCTQSAPPRNHYLAVRPLAAELNTTIRHHVAAWSWIRTYVVV